MENKFIRNEMLLTKEVCDKLSKLKILVVGVGGVGGYAIESLVRLGVNNFTLVDYDCVEISNFNRQIIALEGNLGKSKVEAFKDRILQINSEATVDCKKMFYNKENENLIFDKEYDFVIDAIDTLSLKWELIKASLSRNIDIISSMGMGNRMDLTKIEVTTLNKTYNDPVSKKLREFARKDMIDLKKVNVIFSKEEAKKINCRTPASIIFTPAVSGLLIGQYILEKIIKDFN